MNESSADALNESPSKNAGLPSLGVVSILEDDSRKHFRIDIADEEFLRAVEKVREESTWPEEVQFTKIVEQATAETLQKLEDRTQVEMRSFQHVNLIMRKYALAKLVRPLSVVRLIVFVLVLPSFAFFILSTSESLGIFPEGIARTTTATQGVIIFTGTSLLIVMAGWKVRHHLSEDPREAALSLGGVVASIFFLGLATLLWSQVRGRDESSQLAYDAGTKIALKNRLTGAFVDYESSPTTRVTSKVISADRSEAAYHLILGPQKTEYVVVTKVDADGEVFFFKANKTQQRIAKVMLGELKSYANATGDLELKKANGQFVTLHNYKDIASFDESSYMAVAVNPSSNDILNVEFVPGNFRQAKVK